MMGTKGMSRRPSRRLCLTVVLLASTSLGHAQVVPDGGTATTATVNSATGVTNVQIAPTANPSGISHNTYSDFSVATPGVNLDNRTVNARTILNEVTSSRRSNLNGPLEILGPRAHLIIANPNGVSVNGGSFTNTGGVVLSTGKPSIVTRQIAPNFTQDNVVLETSSGQIDIGAAGLSGAMTSLQLIAGKIHVDGPVENNSTNLRSGIDLLAGGSSVEYDSAVLPISDLEDWGRVTEKGVADSGAAVEITSRGSLKANTVRIRATNQGAGVSHAGSGLASLGDFVIDANGKVTTTGSIRAARHVRIKAPSVATSSVRGQPQAAIEAINGALTILATTGDVTNTGVLMSGSQRDEFDANSKGAATVRAAGDISLLTENADQLAIVFADKGELVAEAGGDIVNNTGRLLSNDKTTLTAGGNIENIADVVGGTGTWQREVKHGKRLWYTLWQVRRKTERISIGYGVARVEGQQAYVVGTSVTANAGGDIINRGSTINANVGAVDLAAARIMNEGGLSGSLEFYRSCALTCVGWGSSDVSSSGGAINAATDVLLTATTSVSNKYGQIVGFRDINVKAPDVDLEGSAVPTVIKRPTGLYNFWRGPSAWIGAGPEGGAFVAPQGKITIEAFRPVQVTAGVLQARDGVIAPNGIEIVSAPESTYLFGKKPIGLYRNLVGK